jgi:hypothetical protein
MKTNRAAGVRIYSHFEHGMTNNSFQSIRGATHLGFSIKKISGDVNFGAVRIFVNAGYTLYYTSTLTAYTSIDQSWTQISVPLSELRGLNDGDLITSAKLEKGISEIGIYFQGGSGLGGVIGLDEIKLTGGTEDLLWYGDDHTQSGDAEAIREQTPAALFVSARPTSGGYLYIPPIPNQAPSVNAGADRTITLPTQSLTLTGQASDSDGQIVSQQWTNFSGLGHDAWTRTYTSYPSQSYATVPNVNQPTIIENIIYNRQMMWDWMFRQVRP